jgi:hypothetical protein
MGCSNFMNNGVTFWHVPSSRQIRQEIFDRGLSMYRAVYDDQECFNEIVNTHYDKLTILPCQYNYRAYLDTRRWRWPNVSRCRWGWPTVNNLDGVKIYHNPDCCEAAKKLLPVAPMPSPKPLPKDTTPPNRWAQLWRRYRHKLWRYE